MKMTWCSHHGPHFYTRRHHVAIVWNPRGYRGRWGFKRIKVYNDGGEWYLYLGPIMVTSSEG